MIAVGVSFYLMWMHALNYTKPREQRQIIRILMMVPIYAASGFLQIYYYYHAIYFQVMSDCYEAFAIASFFTLMCHYMAPDLHEQKDYFRNMRPIKPWVWPVDWFAWCCGRQRGIWRTPKSGLTWFNIIWIGIYHYCFIRVAMTITAVVTQYFDRYCESSNSPVFAHIWVLTINSLAVTVAMYCVIQFYVQLKKPLHEHKPFLKVLSIKLVIFLVFWQMMAMSVATSSDLVTPNQYLQYPDIKVGIPALLLTLEMTFFAVLHLWAFPWAPYRPGAPPLFYPLPDPDAPNAPPSRENTHSEPSGGPLGLYAFMDALNIWDVVKAFGRGMRWLFCGVKNRKEDTSYQAKVDKEGLELGETNSYAYSPAHRSTDHLPIASQFRRSAFWTARTGSPSAGNRRERTGEEGAGLIAHAQASPSGGIGRQWVSRHQGSPNLATNSSYASPAPGVIPPSPYRDTGRLETYREETYEEAMATDVQARRRYQDACQAEERTPGRRIAGDTRQQFPPPRPPRSPAPQQGTWGAGGRI